MIFAGWNSFYSRPSWPSSDCTIDGWRLPGSPLQLPSLTSTPRMFPISIPLFIRFLFIGHIWLKDHVQTLVLFLIAAPTLHFLLLLCVVWFRLEAFGSLFVDDFRNNKCGEIWVPTEPGIWLNIPVKQVTWVFNRVLGLPPFLPHTKLRSVAHSESCDA